MVITCFLCGVCSVFESNLIQNIKQIEYYNGFVAVDKNNNNTSYIINSIYITITLTQNLDLSFFNVLKHLNEKEKNQTKIILINAIVDRIETFFLKRKNEKD